MTKFEEELNKIEVEVQTPLDKYIVEKAASDESLYAQHYEAVLEKFKDWHSDEDYQRAKRMVEHVQVENEMLKAKLKSQLQQQALPVVPECVAVAIEKDKQANISISDVFEATFSYENHHLTEAGLWTKNNPEKYIIARNIGYTVEKPQLFYLKNKLTSMYLAYDGMNDLYEAWETKAHKFTQEEIGNMETGSYEQIPVPVEDNK